MADLIDFEAELARRWGAVDGAREPLVTAKERDLSAAAAAETERAVAPRIGLRAWLEHCRRTGEAATFPGRSFDGWLRLTGVLAFLLMMLTGVSAVLASVDKALSGIHVILFLALVLGVQWLILAAGTLLCLLRGRRAAPLGPLKRLFAELARRLAGTGRHGWWRNLVESGGHGRSALAWRLARLAQAGGSGFNCGALAGLAAVVLLRNCGFFWETTTSGTMRAALGKAVALLASPWSWWWPQAVPGNEIIEATRRLPEHSGPLPPGPEQWWLFLMMALAVWGLLPRLAFWLACRRGETRALARHDFQERRQRQLWRALTSESRLELDRPPLDGALDQEALRPFLLRRLRVNPTAWESVAVLDPTAELQAAAALARAPAGVVLIDEGWALSPPRMTALHRQIRSLAGPDREIMFLALNLGPDGLPEPPTAVEAAEWEKFVDSLRDPLSRAFVFEKPESNGSAS